MTEEELADKLRPLQEDDPDGLKLTRFHLFGIRYHQEINLLGRGAQSRIWEWSGGKMTKEGTAQAAPLSYGINLGSYVQIRGNLPPSLAFLAE